MFPAILRGDGFAREKDREFPISLFWGRTQTNGRELVEEFASKIEAGQALEAVAEAKRRRGYQDLFRRRSFTEPE